MYIYSTVTQLPTLPHYLKGIYMRMVDLLRNFGVPRYIDLLTSPLFVGECATGAIAVPTIEAAAAHSVAGLPSHPTLAAMLDANIPRILAELFARPSTFTVHSPEVFLFRDADGVPVAVCPPSWIRSALLAMISELATRRTAARRNAALPKAGVWQGADGVIYPTAWATSGHIPQSLRRAIRAAVVRGMPPEDFADMVTGGHLSFTPDKAALEALRPLAEEGVGADFGAKAAIVPLRLALYAPRWLGLPAVRSHIVESTSKAFVRVPAAATIDDLLAILEPTLAALRAAGTVPGEPLLPTPEAMPAQTLQAFSLRAATDAETLLKEAGGENGSRAVRRWFRSVALRYCPPGETVVQLVSMPVAAALMWYWVWVAPLMHSPLRSGPPPGPARQTANEVANALYALGHQSGDYNATLFYSSLHTIHAELHYAHVREPS